MDGLDLFIALFFLFFLEKWISISLFFTIFHEISCQPNSFFFSLILWTGKRDFLSVSVIIFLMLVSNFWETTFVCFSNLRFSIDPFSSISTAQAAGPFLLLLAQKKEARKGPGNRLHVRFALKTRFLLPTSSYRKRGRTVAIR